MGDMSDDFRALKSHKKALRLKYGVDCPRCRQLRPKTNSTILLPGQRCRVDGFIDMRPELTDVEYQNVY